MTYEANYKSPIGNIIITAEKDFLTSLSFTQSSSPTEIKNRLIIHTIKQLNEYFAGNRTEFDLPLNFVGYTPFLIAVWSVLQKIPFGRVLSYSEIAEKIDNKNSARAVGSACGKNPYPIIIPCHRAINKGGNIGGFSAGVPRKEWLLDFERRLR